MKHYAMAVLAALAAPVPGAAFPLDHGPVAPFTSTAALPDGGPGVAPWERLVLVVHIEGLTARLAKRNRTPFLDRLGQSGISAAMRTTAATRSIASLASLVTGRSPDVHGFTGDRWRSWAGTLRTPSIFDLAHRAGMDTSVIGARHDLRMLNDPSQVDAFQMVKADSWSGTAPAAAVVEAAQNEFQRGRRGLVMLSIRDLADHTRRYGKDTPQAAGAVARVDRALAGLAQWVDESGLSDRTTWILAGTPDQRSAPVALAISGAGVAQAGTLGEVDLLDVAPTLAALLNQPSPTGTEGNTLRQAVVRLGDQDTSGQAAD